MLKILIYLITNNFNNLVYIGQARISLENRIYWYKKDIRSKKKPNEIIKAMREYGFENFSFTVLEDNINDQNILDELERYWISYYDANNPEKGYNRDTGGISGGSKSKETKALIGATTKEKWNNEDTARRMREGLKKGTETVKERAKNNYVIINCLNCGSEIKVKPHVAKHRKFCNTKCLGEYNAKTGKAKEVCEKGAVLAHKRNIERKMAIKEDIIKWVKENKNLVLNCPFNKITTQLAPLFQMIENKHCIKDIRSLFICFDVNGRKELLKVLQTYC